VSAAFNEEFTVRFFLTENQGDATALTKVAISAGCTELIEVGGNGTLNEVINGVMRSKVFTGGVK
jgi:diacylglycerol kinase family enzyme